MFFFLVLKIKKQTTEKTKISKHKRKQLIQEIDRQKQSMFYL